jgi:hypothetical protein
VTKQTVRVTVGVSGQLDAHITGCKKSAIWGERQRSDETCVAFQKSTLAKLLAIPSIDMNFSILLDRYV